MTPVVIGDATLYLGDAHEILPALQFDAVIPELEANGFKFERKQEGHLHFYKLVPNVAVGQSMELVA